MDVDRREVIYGLEETACFHSVRLWGGPSLRLSYHLGGANSNNDFSAAGIGIGPVVGLNIGLSKTVALTLRTGFYFTGYAGDWKNSGGPSNDFSMSEARWFLNFGMLFGELN